MMKENKDYNHKSKYFNCKWILLKAKTIVSGLDTKTNLQVSLHTAILNFMLMKKYDGELNYTYLTRFKSMISTLKIADGDHIFVSKEMIKRELKDTTNDKINEERGYFVATCFILRTNESTYKKRLYDLKSSSNRGCDNYPCTLTDTFDLLTREPGRYDTVRPMNIKNETRGRGWSTPQSNISGEYQECHLKCAFSKTLHPL